MNRYSNQLLVLWSAIVLLVIGCTTEKKATKYMQKHPEVSAKLCAETYPVKESVIVRDSVHFDTLYVDGEPVFVRDTVYTKGDTVIKVIEKKCPQNQTIVKTINHDSIIVRENTAQIANLQNIINNLQSEINSRDETIAAQDATIKTKNKWIWWLLLVCIGLGLWTVRKPLLTLIKL